MEFSGGRALPITLVFILGSLWGLHFSLIKICSESGLSHLAILTASTIGVAAAFTLICIFRRTLPKISGQHLLFYITCSVLGYIGPVLIELTVAKHMEAGLLTLIVSTTPLVTLVLATILRTESVKFRGLLGVCLGCVAIAILVVPKLVGDSRIAWSIVFLTFLVPLAYGLFHNFVAKFWPEGSTTWQIACGEMITSCIFLIPFSLFQAGPDFVAEQLFPHKEWQLLHWAIVVMVIFAVLEVYLYYEIIRLAGAVTVSLSNFVTIAAGVVWGMLIFGESPSLRDWLCVGVLLLALYLVLGKRKF